MATQATRLSPAQAAPALGPARTLRSQVRESLRARILGGDWKIGERMPSESELIAAHGVSRITVRQALADLVAEGLVERTQGKGSFVAPGPVRMELSRLEGLVEALSQQGRTVSTQVISWEPARPDPPVARLLGLAAGQRCLELQTLRLADGQPLSHNFCWIEPAIGRRLPADALAASDLLTLYETALGKRVARASVEMRAALATQAQCGLLSLPSPAAVLQVDRTVYAPGDQALHHERSVYASDAFSYRLELAR